MKPRNLETIFFFDDGEKTHRVLDLESKIDCFECNGQYSHETVGYILKLANDIKISFKFCDDKIAIG